MVGIDRINTNLLTKNRGFPRSALMRGYVRHRPYLYVPNEPQRITVQNLAGPKKNHQSRLVRQVIFKRARGFNYKPDKW